MWGRHKELILIRICHPTTDGCGKNRLINLKWLFYESLAHPTCNANLDINLMLIETAYKKKTGNHLRLHYIYSIKYSSVVVTDYHSWPRFIRFCLLANRTHKIFFSKGNHRKRKEYKLQIIGKQFKTWFRIGKPTFTHLYTTLLKTF